VPKIDSSLPNPTYIYYDLTILKMQTRIITAVLVVLAGFVMTAPVPGSTYQIATYYKPDTDMNKADQCEGGVDTDGSMYIEGVACLKS
jgi:hypothetical protein